MDRGLALATAVVLGGGLAAQAPLNSALGRAVGGVQASMIALGVSFVALVAISALAGGFRGLARAGEVPLYVLLGGGLVGGLYVGSIVFTVRELGAGGLTAATVAGTLTVAIVIDHFGWLDVTRSPLNAAKVLGIVFLALGTYLVLRD